MEKTDRNKTIGERVKKFREARGWSQNQLAKEMLSRPGVDSFHAMTVKRIEDGQRELKLSEIINLASALDVTIDSLVSNDEHAQESERILSLSRSLDEYAGAKKDVVAGISRMYLAIREMQGYFQELDGGRETPRFKNNTVLKAYEAAFIEQGWEPIREGVERGCAMRSGGEENLEDWQVINEAAHMLGIEENRWSAQADFLFDNEYYRFTNEF